jgi:DNA-binding GntR family transcriptional regulator
VISTAHSESNLGRGVSALRRRILAGEVRPGGALREVALAAELGVSRNTLREILLVLASEGLVQHVPHRGGARVVQLGVRDARDIYLVRQLIESAAVERAASRPLEASEYLSAALRRLEDAAAAHDLDRLVEADLGFHRSLAAVLESDRLSALFRRIETQLRLAFSIVAFTDREYEQPEPLVDEHRRLHQLITDGDVGRAKDALLAHLAKYETRLIAVLREQESAVEEQG